MRPLLDQFLSQSSCSTDGSSGLFSTSHWNSSNTRMSLSFFPQRWTTTSIVFFQLSTGMEARRGSSRKIAAPFKEFAHHLVSGCALADQVECGTILAKL